MNKMNTRKKTLTQSENICKSNADICRLVSDNPCLYDRSNPDYLRKSVVNNVWKKISKEMKQPANICQQRWRNIRTSFARSIKDHHGANTYYLKSELEFLQKHITPGVPVPYKGRRSRGSGQEMAEDQTDEDYKPKLENLLDAQSRNNIGHKDADTDSDEDSKENVKASISNGQAAPIVDFDDAFLQGLRPEMKEMNFSQKLYFKRRVYDVLGEIFPSEMPTTSAADTSTPRERFGLKLQLPKIKTNTEQNNAF